VSLTGFRPRAFHFRRSASAASRSRLPGAHRSGIREVPTAGPKALLPRRRRMPEVQPAIDNKRQGSILLLSTKEILSQHDVIDTHQ